uniref:Uncharacterized protein n=1 Tax=Ochrobactrum sp. LM19 TaxID=1449781 RepID=A0A0D5A0G5_9HYPH|nr:hypothetical protein [Ochrobactrum sp. LM19]AJW30027.1 hypothetical protein pLM19O2_p82 [Ochrobactrum sp. LM19]
MAQKPDFMKAVKAVGHQMEQTALHNATEPKDNPHRAAQTPQGSEEGGAGKNGNASHDTALMATTTQRRKTAKGSATSVTSASAGQRVSATIYMDQQIYRRLKVLAAIEGNRLNDYFLEALDDYIARIGDRLPKL